MSDSRRDLARKSEQPFGSSGSSFIEDEGRFPGSLNATYLISVVRSVWNRVHPPIVHQSSSNLNSQGRCQITSFGLSDQQGTMVGCAPSSTAGIDFFVDSSEAVTSAICFKLILKRLCSESYNVSSSSSFSWLNVKRGKYLENLMSVYDKMKVTFSSEAQPVIYFCKERNVNRFRFSGSKTRGSSLDATPICNSLGTCNFPYSSYQDGLEHFLAYPTVKIMGSKRLVRPIDCKIVVVYSNCCKFTDFLDELVNERSENHPENLVIELKEAQIESSTLGKQQYISSAKVHAYAGACAGIFVSLCLHPFDTIKTFIQSHGMKQKSSWCVGRSVIAERGVTGLYRGLLSKIACSSPISCIYTCTYESTKGVLVTLIPKEYSSCSHCISGACASVATSFVFTPSEHVKQQMQLMPHYRNCWTALLEIIRKGGFPSLYVGWKAVLCRNVPHSIIKLTCGGLAGVSAALFTTPFDVVKTRLQTQVPGSPTQYRGVINALEIISKREGIKGLFRGLVPRLGIYMSQGALFFTSYECAKRLLPLVMQ